MNNKKEKKKNKVYIENNGRIGFGTSNPKAILDIMVSLRLKVELGPINSPKYQQMASDIL